MKFLLIWLLCLLTITLSAQNLTDRQKQLDDLKEKISKQEEHIKQLESAKKKAEKDLQSQKKNKQETERKIRELEQNEAKAREQLSFTQRELFSTENKLQFLQNLLHDEINKLAYAHYEKKLFPDKEIDTQLLAFLIHYTTYEMDSFSGKKDNLEAQKSRQSRHFEDVQWSRIVNVRKNKEIQSTITKTSKNIDKTKAEQETAQKQKEQFEKEAQQLNELIARLQINVVEQDFSYQFSTPKLMWPLKGKVIRPFGENKSDVYNVSVLNNGIDIAAPERSEVKAVDNGVIAYADRYEGAGRLVIVDHQNGYYTIYSHNSSLLVSRGDSVSRGQVIALSGKSGSAEEPCLHFEIRRRGTPINPLDYLE
jgi:septal ring factor EnvC (AmiA/AmiB activator)